VEVVRGLYGGRIDTAFQFDDAEDAKGLPALQTARVAASQGHDAGQQHVCSLLVSWAVVEAPDKRSASFAIAVSCATCDSVKQHLLGEETSSPAAGARKRNKDTDCLVTVKHPFN
jgi:hypothetical protein